MNNATTVDAATFAELQDAAGADFVKELVQTFFEEAPVMLQEMRDALAAGNADNFRRAAHSLKSNSLTFGAMALGAMARKLELEGLATESPSGAIEALADELQRVETSLKALTHD